MTGPQILRNTTGSALTSSEVLMDPVDQFLLGGDADPSKHAPGHLTEGRFNQV